MQQSAFKQAESLLKRSLKGKVIITRALVISFLMTGLVSVGGQVVLANPRSMVIQPEFAVHYADDFGSEAMYILDPQGNNKTTIEGGATDESNLVDGNIGVKVSGDGNNATLEVKLNKDLNLFENGSVTTGNTRIDNTGLTVGNTAITAAGLTNGSTTITGTGVTTSTVTADTVNAGSVTADSVKANIFTAGTNVLNGTGLTINNSTNPANNVVINGDKISMGGKRIEIVEAGRADTDAVNVKQLHDEIGNAVNPLRDEIGNAVNSLRDEMYDVGASAAALGALKPLQYDPLEPTQIMVGYGNYRGSSALAMGVAHYKNESTMFHAGVSWAGGSSHMMANAGITWKVGSRDSETAVADRYRKDPISAAYAMQNEMAAMKAQNAGLKGEVADLKAENEQIKAQIAAMMAKLGL